MEKATSPTDRSHQLKAWALDEGFDLAGTCPLAEASGGAAYAQWVARGDAAGMTYMARRMELRSDPRRLVPGARSALCVGWRYWPVVGESRVGDLWRGVARYARGRDYHEVMTARLRRLNDRIEGAFPGARGRWYVDTGPILERELAARAGIGSVGKNTNLLSPEGGSWFLLGEILLNLELSADTGVSDLCGSCTACLDACPTGALPEPYRLDSNRCISYWTIEHRGPIPVAVRSSLGEWVFGCDVCQEVCPVNEGREAVAGDAENDLRPTDVRRALDLAALLGLGRDEYVAAFRGSPMKRAKRAGLKRNAAVAMGNRRDPRYVAALAQALSDEDEVVRSHAAWALGEIGGQPARVALASAWRAETSAAVREEIERASLRLDGADVRGAGERPGEDGPN